MQLVATNLVRRVSTTQVISRYAYSTQRVRDIGQPTPASHPHLMAEGEVTPGIRIKEYIGRRKKLVKLLPENSLAIISSAPVKMMTDIVPYIFRQEADYLYLTGCQQPGGVAVLSEERGLCLFMPESTPNDIVWQGEVAGVDVASEVFKAEQAYPISRLPEILSDMIRKSSEVFHNVQMASQYTKLDEFQDFVSLGKVKALSSLTHELRLIKSPAELRLMRESASIACQGVLKTMLYSKGFPDEGILSAQVDYECRVRGAQRMAFNPVVSGGPNASVIHYSRNDQRIKDGDLVLMYMGCELHGYLSDFTRTWPPCGKFSPLQEELYDLVLQTNKDCIKLCKPGTTIRQLNLHSVTTLGMDVHDCSSVGIDRPFQPGFVITIQPGVHIPTSFDCPERFKGIGIRIEDEVLITETGCEVLTESMPKEIKDIETLLNNDYHENSGQRFVRFSS